MPSRPIIWRRLPDARANRVRKLCDTDEYVLIADETARHPSGVYRYHYDPVDRVFYRELTFQDKPSKWDVAPLPPNPDDAPDDEDSDDE